MDQHIELPRGFRAAGVSCGIKSEPGTLDLALFVSDVPCTSAGVFTQNKVVGAPVKVTRMRVPRTSTRSVIINSGNSNACTGEQGFNDARWMTATAAKLLECSEEDVLVCSTGVIGRTLPVEKLAAGIPQVVSALAETPQAFHTAARAMMTTDTFPKLATRVTEFRENTLRVSGCAKGAAMIGPNMATMLAVIMTDALLTDYDVAHRMLRDAVNRSFNCISVEGHTSTSDTVIFLANGMYTSTDDDEAATLVPLNAAETQQLQDMVDEVAMELAMAIVRDAEGADHFITIEVNGTRNHDDALRIAKTVADSALVKTAIAGGDPNWGRIVSAVGYSGVSLREEDISLRLNGVPLYKSGSPVPFDAAAVSKNLKENRDVLIQLDLELGATNLKFWTSDLTSEYVRLNADYTT